MRSASRVSLDCSRAKEGLQHQRAGEEKGDPEQARAVAARFCRRGIEDKAEEHDDHERENDRGGEQFAGAELEAKFLGEQDGGGADGGHDRRLCPGAKSASERPRVASPSRYRARRGRRRARRRAWRGRAIRCARACS